jgi:exonuclease SbcC
MVNWKSHLDSEIKFSKGVNALIGIMGSGKTSVMQAIAFALFGTFSALGSKKLVIDDLIMGKPQKKANAMVEVEFTTGDNDQKTYIVRRTLERGKGTVAAEIHENGKLLEVNPQGVTREIERVLQMDYDLFQRAIYSEQNALDYFLQIPKGRRMQQIDEMLKLDRYEKARESAVFIKNRLLERRKEMLRVVEDLKARKLDEKLAGLKKEISKMEGDKSELEKNIGALEKERRKLSERVVEYEASHEMLNEAVKKGGALGSRIAEMHRQADGKRKKLAGARVSADTLKEMAGEITKLETSLFEKEMAMRELRNSVANANGRMLFSRDQIKEAKEKLTEGKEKDARLTKLGKSLGMDCDKRLTEMLEDLEALKKTLYSLMAEKNEMEKSLSDLKRAGDKCPVCESHIAEGRKKEILDHRLQHIIGIDLRIREAKDKLARESSRTEEFRKNVLEFAELKRDLRDYDSFAAKLKEHGSKIKLLAKEASSLVVQIRRKEKEEKTARQMLEKLRVRKDRAEDALKEKEELESLVKEINELEKQLSGIVSQRKSLERKLVGKDIKSMRLALQEAVAKSRGIETRLADASQMLKDKEVSQKEMAEQLEILAKYMNDTERYAVISESMDVFVSVLRSTQDQLRDEFLKTVNYIMNHVWGELYPYGDFSEIRLLVDKDYVLQLKSAREWMNADVVSGGERSLASLALRIAFSLAFTPNLRWLILDEPTHNLDRNAIDHFGTVLKDRMENIIEQVFLITHEERLSDYITGSTYRLERDKESDGVTKIAEI